MLELAEKFANLPATDVHEYFRGFRAIQNELDAEQYKIQASVISFLMRYLYPRYSD